MSSFSMLSSITRLLGHNLRHQITRLFCICKLVSGLKDRGTAFVIVPLGYTHTPLMIATIAHLAPTGQPTTSHVRAQYLLPCWSCNMHCGFARTFSGHKFAGTSVGQLP